MTKKFLEFKHLLAEIWGDQSGKQIAERISRTAGYVSRLRSGQEVPNDALLALIAERFAPDRLQELLFTAARQRIAVAEGFDSESLRSKAIEAFSYTKPPDSHSSHKEKERTFSDFPGAFEPLVVITGDKRESRGQWIDVGDFGARTASPADSRWIMELELGADVVKHIDKNFVLLPEDELIELFCNKNLLVIGSPAANHLARRINKSSIFRFNYSTDAERAINSLITKAANASRREREVLFEKTEETQAKMLRSFFTGGIFDPTYPEDYVTATYAQIAPSTQLDFGVLSFASNPFYVQKQINDGKREIDNKYVSILAAGIHHPGTAHAVKMLGKNARKRHMFDYHPYGGVLRIVLDLTEPFPHRVEKAECFWEDERAGGRQPQKKPQKVELIDNLRSISKQLEQRMLSHLNISKKEVDDCLTLLDTI